jgi:hypothetical protein
VKKPTEEQLERLMYLIELPAMMDEESVGDRFDFENIQEEESFIPRFIIWLETENPELYREVEEKSNFEVEYLFWFDPITKGHNELEYRAFKECAKYIYTHPEAFEGVIKEITWFLEDDVNKEFKWWDDIARDTGNFICSLEDAKREFEILKNDYGLNLYDKTKR